MNKIDNTVKKETLSIAIISLVFSVILQIVFAVTGLWNMTVFFGNLLGYSAAVLNFLLMGITVQKAVQMDEEGARKKIRTSQSLRLLMLVLFSVAAIILKKYVSLLPYLISLLFPRFSITIRQLMIKNKEK